MYQTALIFPTATLNLFSVMRAWFQQGFLNPEQYCDGFLWGVVYGMMIYSNIHLGHFTKREVTRMWWAWWSSSIIWLFSGSQDWKFAAQNCKQWSSWDLQPKNYGFLATINTSSAKLLLWTFFIWLQSRFQGKFLIILNVDNKM